MAQTRQTLLSRWDDVRFLLAVLREGSFTEAARALGTDQSTVSRRIAQLEEALGVALFERSRRAPLATEAALRLREAAERVEAEVGRFSDDALEAQSPQARGRVRLALTEEMAIHFVVPRVIPRLRREHPGLSLDLISGYRAVDLAGHEADLALRFFRTEHGDLLSQRVARMPTVILASRSYARRHRGAALSDLDWVSVELAGLSTPESAWLEAHVARPPALICSSYQVQLAAIRAGIGVGVGPAAFTAIDRGFVALDLPRVALPTLDLFLVTRRSIRRLPRVEAVIGALVDEFSSIG